MKQSDIFVLDKCEITVDKKNYTLNTKWIYTIWESQKVLLCAPLSPYMQCAHTVCSVSSDAQMSHWWGNSVGP